MPVAHRIEPPAPPPGSRDYKYYDNDIKYFKKQPDANWNAGKDKSGRDPAEVKGVDTANMCANVCMSNASCMSFVFNSSSKKCFFRKDLSRDNYTNYVCNEKIAGADPENTRGCNDLDNIQEVLDTDTANGVTSGCGGRATGKCWSVNGSSREDNSQTYWKLQDPMEKQCPDACAKRGLCQASMWTKNDCSIFEFKPTVKVDEPNFTTQWKFDYFPGN